MCALYGSPYARHIWHSFDSAPSSTPARVEVSENGHHPSQERVVLSTVGAASQFDSPSLTNQTICVLLAPTSPCLVAITTPCQKFRRVTIKWPLADVLGHFIDEIGALKSRPPLSCAILNINWPYPTGNKRQRPI